MKQDTVVMQKALPKINKNKAQTKIAKKRFKGISNGESLPRAVSTFSNQAYFKLRVAKRACLTMCREIVRKFSCREISSLQY